MKRMMFNSSLLALFLAIAISSPVYAKSCSSDYSCGMGYTCVKDLYKSRGTCMKTVNRFGVQQFNSPSSSSIGIRGYNDAQCTFNTDCPIGFKCDRGSKVCIKR